MKEKTFKLCLTMAGAVSAGAYTAGVIDELLTALDLWEKAKMRNRELGPGHPGYDHSIPMHHVELEVLSGASAGGITAALAIRKMLDGGYDTMDSNTLLRDCWVHMADEEEKNTLEKLLDTADLNPSATPRSLLNASPIEDLAHLHLQPLKTQKRPAWLSPRAEVVLTATNLEGIDVNIHFNGSATPNSGHSITQHSSVFRFVPVVGGDKETLINDLYSYPADLQKEEAMSLLRDAALSTSAFPLGLPTRKVKLPHKPYLKYQQEDRLREGLHIDPEELTSEKAFPAIDGGLLNNEPYGWALKILRENCKAAYLENRYAVVMIDPLPSKPPTPSKQPSTGLWPTFTAMFRALRNEVMLNQEGITEAISLQDRTKFLVAPRKGGNYPPKLNVMGKVLASAPISGFAGFISKDLRAHDYELGRRNCRDFIRFHFTLPTAEAEKKLHKELHPHMKNRFCIIPRGYKTPETLHFPIIPDVRLKEARSQLLLSGYNESYHYPELPDFNTGVFMSRYGSLLDKRLVRLVRSLTGKWWLSLAFRCFLLPSVRKKLYGIVQKEMEFFEEAGTQGESKSTTV